MPSFSAVLLAGGQSTRMGRDKALVPKPGSDLLLWQWQLRTIEELHPEQIFWSGAPRPGLPTNLHIVADEVHDAGPLAGISACLDLLQNDLLVVLAIDLPQMNAVFLQGLLAKCSPDIGVVARHGDMFEPLAAIYPKTIRILANERLNQGHHSIQDLIRKAVQLGLMQIFPTNEKEIALFKNVNSPADL
jgi:molybdopterin-guanine dinucleotide biosynthesis protein A